MVDRLKNITKQIRYFLTSKIFLINLGIFVLLMILLYFVTTGWMKSYTKHGSYIQVPKFVDMDILEAQNIGKKKNLNLLVIDSSTYNPKVKGGVILEQSPTPTAKVKEQRSVYLTISKYIPNDVMLPDLVGNYDAANYARKLQRKGLKSQIAKKIFDANQQPNTILYIEIDGKRYTDDDISKGVFIAEGKSVDLIVTDQGGTLTDVPDLNCISYAEAKFILDSYNLNLGSIVKDATVKDQNSAFIWQQSPTFSSGKTVNIGATIDVFLTQFKPKSCK